MGNKQHKRKQSGKVIKMTNKKNALQRYVKKQARKSQNANITTESANNAQSSASTETAKNVIVNVSSESIGAVSRVKERLLPPPPPSPPREPTEEELAQMKLEKEKQELKRKLQLDTVDFVGSLESRALRVRPAKRLKSDGEHYSEDGSEQDKSCTLTEPLRVKCDDSVATPDNGELDVLHQTGDTENGQNQDAEGIPCKKKVGRPRKPPQVGPDSSPAKRKRGRPKSSSNKLKLKSDGEHYSEDGSEQDKSCTLTEPLRVKCDDSVATPDNGELDVLHQTGDTEPPQVGPDGSPAKRKRGRPKSFSNKIKRPAQVVIPKEKIIQMRKPNQRPAQVAVPKEKILHMRKPNQACRIIARVYHYLEQEYEFLKANTDKSCDLSLLSNILKRTAGATGFPEPMVKTILEAEEIRKQKLREAAELQHKAEQRRERRLQREFEKKSSVKRKKNKNAKKNSTSEVAKVNSETSSDLATGINSDTLVNSGNVSNKGNSEMAADINSDPLAVKIEVLDEEYGDSLVTGIQQSIKPVIAITITAPTARLHPPANEPPHGPPQPAENVSEEPEVYAPLVTDPEELERIEAKSAAGILQALLKADEDPLG